MTEIIVAAISLLGTLGGSLGGILVSSKMTNYRIQQLENKVAEHNNFARRMPVVEEQIKVANHRIEDLEKERKIYTWMIALALLVLSSLLICRYGRKN